MGHDECGKLFGASKSLLTKSGLVRYKDGSFAPEMNEDRFEAYWQENFDPEFGRYMAWVWFSVGAENLLKAALECHGLLCVEHKYLGYPVFSLEVDKKWWRDQVMKCQQSDTPQLSHDEAQKHEYGRLRRLVDNKRKLAKLGLRERDVREFRAAYSYLTDVIRNRDAHSYVKNQRRRDFPAVEGIFVPAFNTLVQTMKSNEHFSSDGDR